MPHTPPPTTHTTPGPGSPGTSPDPTAQGLVRFFRRRSTQAGGAAGSPWQLGGLLAGLRIRKKLMVLHTGFSVGLMLLLILALRPAVREVVERAERSESAALASGLVWSARQRPGHEQVERAADLIASMPDITIRRGGPAELAAVALSPGSPSLGSLPRDTPMLASDGTSVLLVLESEPHHGESDRAFLISARMPEARDAVTRLFIFAVLVLVGAYAGIAVALELFVLPRNVYAPIRTMLEADRALREGRMGEELIPDGSIPRDEMGEIMRSRNESVGALRHQERELAVALLKLESVANDLKLKNHLLETARRNLADADRLASLGMMSAGIAHELNTPLAVVKGLAERLAKEPEAGLDGPTAALMLRVVGRLERLGESLLDFARARPPSTTPTRIREVVEEALTLLRLERGTVVPTRNMVPADLVVPCDADRMVQVFVNLIRNARNAICERPEGVTGDSLIVVDGRVRDGRSGDTVGEAGAVGGEQTVELSVTDNGPGIDPSLLPSLFEPFATTRLDAKGTGLGLAVADGIIREHHGVLLARTRTEGGAGAGGARFEIILPCS